MTHEEWVRYIDEQIEKCQEEARVLMWNMQYSIIGKRCCEKCWAYYDPTYGHRCMNDYSRRVEAQS